MSDLHGLIFTGTNGSGKSSISAELVKTGKFVQVGAVTTRKARPDDLRGTYEYLEQKAFDDLAASGEFFLTTNYRGASYGIRNASLEEAHASGKTPILIITPEAMAKFLADQPPDSCGYLSFFIDAPDAELDRRLAKQKRAKSDEDNEIRKQDRARVRIACYDLVNGDLQATVRLVKALWEYRGHSGILHGHLMKDMMKCDVLLVDAVQDQIQGASYDLSLGDEYFYGGQIRRLSDQDPLLLIEPYDYAIVTSNERANLPANVSARFDLANGLFLQGVVLSNGPQVDPGFRGPLFCLLLNASSSPVVLKRRQHYATIEFHKLFAYTGSYTGRYQEKPLLHYLPSNVARGAINELKKELEEVRKQSQKLETWTFTVLALLLAIVGIWISAK